MEQQREDTPKTGPAPSRKADAIPERQWPRESAGEPIFAERLPGAGHEEIGQFPDTGDFGPDYIGVRRG
jgi:hypothetical protein